MNPTSKNPSLDTLSLPNGQHPSSTLLTGGAPDAAMFVDASKAGVRYVFDLRPETERSFDEPAVVAEHGMHYLHLPIAGPQDLTLSNVKAFDALLAKVGDAPTILHCASGNRVGALVALRAAWLNHVAIEEALAIGRAHGLTRMEVPVRALLDSGPA